MITLIQIDKLSACGNPWSYRSQQNLKRGKSHVMAQWLHPPFEVQGSHMGAGSCPSCSTSHPAPYLWPGKAVEEGSKP